MQKREEMRDEGDLGFFLGNMRKTIEEREEDFFFRGELEDRGRRLREKKKESSRGILGDFFFEQDSEENCRHGNHFSGWNF